MTLVRENITSLYRQIADTLRQEIAAGHFQPGGKLPSEAALEQRFAVSRVTVRLALKHLTEQGIVERKQEREPTYRARRLHMASTSCVAFMSR
jgi:DNA-binding GntR family transcriptional regulator